MIVMNETKLLSTFQDEQSQQIPAVVLLSAPCKYRYCVLEWHVSSVLLIEKASQRFSFLLQLGGFSLQVYNWEFLVFIV